MPSLLARIESGEFREPRPTDHPGTSDPKAWLTWRDEHEAECRQRRNAFRAAAMEECGIAGHPKANAAFRLAWEYGSHTGLADVLHYLGQLAELLKD